MKHTLWMLNILVAIAIHYAPDAGKAVGLFVEMVVLNVLDIIERRGAGSQLSQRRPLRRAPKPPRRVEPHRLLWAVAVSRGDRTALAGLFKTQAEADIAVALLGKTAYVLPPATHAQDQAP
jgi:hypothetical protein